jgi:hypothetical protein
VISNLALLDAPFLNHRVQWIEGPMAGESAALLQEFFRQRRAAGGSGAGSRS